MTKVSRGIIARFMFATTCLTVAAFAYQASGSGERPAGRVLASGTTTGFAPTIAGRSITPNPTDSPTPVPLSSATPGFSTDLGATPPASPSPTAVQTPDERESVFDALMAPLAGEAMRRRTENARTDPTFIKRVDLALNEGRVNFLLFGYGESHEPPVTEKAIIGSHSVLSYDLKTRKIDVISLTHDIRGPEIEREFARNGFKSPPVRIDQAYNAGGFKLMRLLLENATGLSMDYQVVFKDAVIQDLVDGVFGGVEVQVPADFSVHPFYLDGKKYERGEFTKGLQRLTGRQVIQFIKTVPVAEGAYDRSLEHNARKALVFDAILRAVANSYSDPALWIKGSGFVTGHLLSGGIAYDFDPVALVINNLGSTATSVQKLAGGNRPPSQRLPKIDRTKYVVDPAQGDGGVQWVQANAAVNPLTKRDIDNGVYPSLDMEIPINANPYGDLVTEYWPSVRALVKGTLISPP